jgi:hypothetical protein
MATFHHTPRLSLWSVAAFVSTNWELLPTSCSHDATYTYDN